MVVGTVEEVWSHWESTFVWKVEAALLDTELENVEFSHHLHLKYIEINNTKEDLVKLTF